MQKLLVLLFVPFCALSSSAAEKADVKNEDVRCEKMMAVKLAEFKAALVENCNLNMPFSTSMSRLLNEETYFYCCHKK